MAITLQSSDNVKFLVNVKIAKAIDLINTILDINLVGRNYSPVPLPNVDSAILSKVLTWVTYHKENPLTSEGDEHFFISGWDAEFLKVDSDTLYKLILAANYLDVKGLLNLICKTLGYMFNILSPEQIKLYFNINNNAMQEEKYTL